MSITPLAPRHLAGVALLEQLSFAEPWSERALELLCKDENFGLVLEDENGLVLAYAGVMTVLDEGQFTNVAVHPDHRRRGLGNALLSAALEEAKKRGLALLSLEVRESNVAAIALYEKHGFTVAGKRPDFYRSPREAALVMTCTLSS